MSTSSTCDVISFSIQGQFFRLTCVGWRDLSNHTRTSTIQSRRLMKLRQNLVTLTRKFPWKSYSTTPVLPFLSSNPKILKVFPKTFAVTKMPSKRKKKKGQEKQEKRRGEKAKRRSKDCTKFCFMCIPELWKLIFCIGIKRPPSVQPVNS